jgi:hypothetical protein
MKTDGKALIDLDRLEQLEEIESRTNKQIEVQVAAGIKSTKSYLKSREDKATDLLLKFFGKTHADDVQYILSKVDDYRYGSKLEHTIFSKQLGLIKIPDDEYKKLKDQGNYENAEKVNCIYRYLTKDVVQRTKDLEEKIEDLKARQQEEGVYYEDLKVNSSRLAQDIINQRKELERLNNLSLFDRIFKRY